MMTISDNQIGKRTGIWENNWKLFIKAQGGVFKTTAHPDDSISINRKQVLKSVNLTCLQELEFSLEVRALS